MVLLSITHFSYNFLGYFWYSFNLCPMSAILVSLLYLFLQRRVGDTYQQFHYLVLLPAFIFSVFIYLNLGKKKYIYILLHLQKSLIWITPACYIWWKESKLYNCSWKHNLNCGYVMQKKNFFSSCIVSLHISSTFY